MKRKKLLVFYSRGGGGHLSASDAITGYLQDRYDIIPVNPFDDILAHLDPMRKLSRNRFSGEDTYNFIIRHGWYRLINIYACRFGASYITAAAPRIRRLVRAYLERAKPDLVISLIPFINAPLADAAHHFGIPCAIVPVDLDPATYVHGLNGSQHDQLYFTIPCDMAAVRNKIAAAGIPPERIRVTGYPVRQAFLAKAETEKIKKSLGISRDRPVIFLLMGANGAKRAFRFAQLIETIDLPAELLIVTGHNNRLSERIAEMPAAPHVKRRVIGHTLRISELMGAADLLVTKSGPTTIFEAIQSDLPMVVDATTSVIRWEKMNISFVEEHELGVVLRRMEDLPEVICRHMSDDAYRAGIREKFAALDKRLFAEEFPALVKELTGA
ncbi:MAG: glycosyltransferase [Proteobacteria bacterium]|nr:glycosyltransferase [Pseudomonadota bacterium]